MVSMTIGIGLKPCQLNHLLISGLIYCLQQKLCISQSHPLAVLLSAGLSMLEEGLYGYYESSTKHDFSHDSRQYL